jgi:peptide/nickel transport system ATP-binding protein
MGSVLEVRDLRVGFHTTRGVVQAVAGVSFDVEEGTTVGIVGESGSGKTATALALMGLLPPEAEVAGSAVCEGTNLLGLSERELERYRGRVVSMVFQDPTTSLNPVLTIGAQIVETLRAHQPGVSRPDHRRRAIALLEKVGVPSPASRLAQYPHQFSGGMRQRVGIAMAIANDPKLIVADEPTTALDVTIQAQILDILRTAQAETSAAAILITHDLGIVAELATRVIVMYAGRIVEAGDVFDVFHRPSHPYTVGLMRSFRPPDKGERLAPIPGSPPNLIALPPGCSFEPRCVLGRGRAPLRNGGSRPEMDRRGASGRMPLHRRSGIAHESGRERGRMTSTGGELPEPVDARARLLEVVDLKMHFPVRGGLLQRKVADVKALDGVDLVLDRGETLAIVGESGCGKSTLGRAILRLYEPTDGTIRFRGVDITRLDGNRLRPHRRQMQMVFQDPYSSLNPLLTVEELMVEPMRLNGLFRGREAERAAELVQRVGLDAEHLDRYPRAFSGGQRQRISIARALAMQPELLILDEPVSALDVSVQAQILNLLLDLRKSSTWRTCS